MNERKTKIPVHRIICRKRGSGKCYDAAIQFIEKDAQYSATKWNQKVKVNRHGTIAASKTT